MEGPLVGQTTSRCIDCGDYRGGVRLESHHKVDVDEVVASVNVQMLVW